MRGNTVIDYDIPKVVVKKLVTAFESIRNVYTAVCGRQLDLNHREFTEKVKTAWEELMKQNVKLSWTPKIHQIIDYFEDPLLEKRSLFHTTIK